MCGVKQLRAFEADPAQIKFKFIQPERFSKRILIILSQRERLAMETWQKPEYHPGRRVLGMERGGKEKKEEC